VAELIASQAMSVVKTGYGKQVIKAARVSPDAWGQLLVQLAYARLLRLRRWQRQGGTYESATTRRFFKGRTEVIRGVTSESDAFLQAMLAEDGADKVEKRKALFEQAAKVHVANAQAAGRGEGVDCHLLGERPAAGNTFPFLGLMTCCAAACVVFRTKVLKEGESVPEMFGDPVVKRASHWVLSTSALLKALARVRLGRCATFLILRSMILPY